MATPAKPPIASDVAEVIGECAENVESRSLLLDKFILHKSWPSVLLETTHQPMKMDDASRWSFIRIAQNGDDFLSRELANCEKSAAGRNVSEENREKAADIRGEVKEIGWGSQIRSYVFQPYTMVKDLRTGWETGNVQAVMDGDLTPFIDAYLKWDSLGRPNRKAQVQD